MTHRLVARLDNVGDVLLAGPAVRAIAAGTDTVTFLAGEAGKPAARLLPGVDRILTFDAPWVSFQAPAVDRRTIDVLMHQVAGIDEAIILTSFHQSPLPLALILRLAGIEHIAATSVDYPGSLLDVRHPYFDNLHEVEQSLSLCAAAGHDLPADDDGSLSIQLPDAAQPRVELPCREYVVVHPGASVPARRLPPAQIVPTVDVLTASGYDVVMTGAAAEAELLPGLDALASRHDVTSLFGHTDLSALAQVVAGATAVVCGNTATAHVAAAVGTPVIEAFAPVVPAHRWHPWRVPHVLLGCLDIGCEGCRARVCPLADQPCLRPFTPQAVSEALDALLPVTEGGAA